MLSTRESTTAVYSGKCKGFVLLKKTRAATACSHASNYIRYRLRDFDHAASRVTSLPSSCQPDEKKTREKGARPSALTAPCSFLRRSIKMLGRRGTRKLQFSVRYLEISDKGDADAGCSKFQFFHNFFKGDI